MLELSKMIVPEAQTWIEYPGAPEFEVQMNHLSRDELVKLRKKATNTKLDRKTRQMVEDVDSEAFQSLYIAAVIKNWRGLKLKYLNKFLVTDIGAEDPEAELEYSIANAEALMKNANDFDAWVTDMLDDIENFTESSKS